MKLLIITGGSKGLGAALVTLYRQQGFHIAEFSRSGSLPESTQIDLSDPAAATATAATAFTKLAEGSYEEILFYNNAGMISPIGPIGQKEEAAIWSNANVNFTSPILMMGQFMQAFQTHPCPKQIVNISSGAATGSIAGWSLYCGAKAGVEHFIRTVAEEQKGMLHPIHTVNISPGLIDTGMQADIRASSVSDFPSHARFVSFKEEGALRSPELVAATILKILDAQPENGSRHQVADYV